MVESLNRVTGFERLDRLDGLDRMDCLDGLERLDRYGENAFSGFALSFQL